MRPLSGMLPWPEVGARKQVGDGPAGQWEDGAPAEEGRAAEEPTWLWGQVSRAELSTVAGPVPGSPSVSGPESWRGGSFRKICLSCCAGERGVPLGGLQRAGGSPVRTRSLTPQFAFAFPVKYSSGLRLEMTFPTSLGSAGPSGRPHSPRCSPGHGRPPSLTPACCLPAPGP